MIKLSDADVLELLEVISKDEYDPVVEKCFGATYRSEWVIKGKKYILYKTVGFDQVTGYILSRVRGQL